MDYPLELNKQSKTVFHKSQVLLVYLIYNFNNSRILFLQLDWAKNPQQFDYRLKTVLQAYVEGVKQCNAVQQQQETHWTIDSWYIHERNKMDERRNERYERRIEKEIAERIKISDHPKVIQMDFGRHPLSLARNFQMWSSITVSVEKLLSHAVIFSIWEIDEIWLIFSYFLYIFSYILQRYNRILSLLSSFTLTCVLW